MSLLQWLLGIFVTLIGIGVTLVVGVLSYNAGARTERARAQHDREARDEDERRKWRDAGAEAIADGMAAMNMIRSDGLRSALQAMQRGVIADARNKWETAERTLIILEATHPDGVVVVATHQLRESAAAALAAAAAAAELFVPGQGSLGRLLENLTKTPREVPTFASPAVRDAAWATSDSAVGIALTAMNGLSGGLRASVADPGSITAQGPRN